MKIAIPDDYQGAVRTLHCFHKLDGQYVVTVRERLSDPAAAGDRTQVANPEALECV